MKPLAPDEMMSVFSSDEVGIYEWICGWTIAHELLNGGMTKINGVPCTVTVVDRWPGIGGIHLRATLEEPCVASERRWAA